MARSAGGGSGQVGVDMSECKIEIRKRHVNPKPKQWWKAIFWTPSCGLTPKVDGYDYYIDGTQVAVARWDGRKLITNIAPEYNGLFGVAA